MKHQWWSTERGSHRGCSCWSRSKGIEGMAWMYMCGGRIQNTGIRRLHSTSVHWQISDRNNIWLKLTKSSHTGHLSHTHTQTCLCGVFCCIYWKFQTVKWKVLLSLEYHTSGKGSQLCDFLLYHLHYYNVYQYILRIRTLTLLNYNKKQNKKKTIAVIGKNSPEISSDINSGIIAWHIGACIFYNLPCI